MIIEHDAFGFTKDGKPFTPIIQEKGSYDPVEYNVFQIRLDATLESSLSWENEIAIAKQVVLQGGLLFWELDFGLAAPTFSLDSKLPFQAFLIAIKEFNDLIWKEFAAHTYGVVMFRGEVNYNAVFPWNQKQREYFEEWESNVPFKEKLYAISALTEYLHALSAKLPEELQIFALFDAAQIESGAELAILLSEKRFSHIHLGVKNSSVHIGALRWAEGYRGDPDLCQIGICVPEESLCSQKILGHLDQLFEEHRGVNFRIVPELMIIEKWEGLDEMIYLEDFITVQGKRQLDGFIAAGGKIRGRGI